ncbi:HET-domain-containing protein [Pyrenochaeta sp. DS3sAY3a]|nr:HET-domain-containing protein [Pyrenochaeta sp. DS3sAY3a]
MENLYTEVPLNLQEQEIRLVKLEYSHVSDPIKCSLQTCKLDDQSPAYVALSYSWGINNRHDDVQLNGVPFAVRRNLWSFLHQMRLQHQYITFWIDAISINQANVLEQNHQVQMMRRIYTYAHSVWVWLGEADELNHSDIGMQYLKTRELFDDRERNYKKLWSPRKAKAVLGLCERRYWKRIWIVQEIMLARKATVICGDQQVNWMKLQQLAIDLQMISDKGRAMHIIGVSNVLESPAMVIVRAKLQWDGSPQPLTSLLEQYHNQQSSDILDKVYALHGLASDSNVIAIDYRISPKALLVEVIYYTCSVQAATWDTKKLKKNLLRFAKLVRDALKVTCTEDELEFHISAARENSEGLKPRQPLPYMRSCCFQYSLAKTYY